jgi:hypothetical protein
LKEKGVEISPYQTIYAANHYRAILDLLYNCIKKGKYPYHIDIDEWLDTEEQQNILLSTAQKNVTANGF